MPEKMEKKCRFSLIFNDPATKAGIEKIAYVKHKSANELINVVLDKYVQDKGELISRYDDLISEAD